MESIKNSIIIKFLTSKDLKVKFIKLAILLFFMSLGLLSDIFVCMVFILCSIYTICEFSADSLIWTLLTAVYMLYSCAGFTFFVMWVFIGVLLLKLVLDLINKKISLKSWRFITIFSLFASLCLLILLPLCKSYVFSTQLNKFSLFALVVLALVYINEINIKNTLLLFVSMVCVMGLVNFIFNQFGLGSTIYKAYYSNGILVRFSPFSEDPNFSGAIIICAIMSWFVAYKKEYINKYLYFGGLTVLGMYLLMTISKACYFIIAIFALYVIVENIVISVKTKNPKHLIELAYYLGVLLIACAICWRYIDSMCQRILNPAEAWWNEGRDDAGLSNLTTGRVDLWLGYLQAIFGSVRILLFGAGTVAEYVGHGATHSMPLDYLYRYGLLVVLVLIALFIVAVLPYLKKAKPYNYVPLICITGIYCSIGSVSVKYIYAFTIIFITLCCNGIEALKEANQSNKLEPSKRDNKQEQDNKVDNEESAGQIK